MQLRDDGLFLHFLGQAGVILALRHGDQTEELGLPALLIDIPKYHKHNTSIHVNTRTYVCIILSCDCMLNVCIKQLQ